MMRSHHVHIPIISNADVLFHVGDTSITMQEGEMWEINNRREHAVENQGAIDRVHLILDYVIPGEKVRDTKGNVIC